MATLLSLRTQRLRPMRPVAYSARVELEDQLRLGDDGDAAVLGVADGRSATPSCCGRCAAVSLRRSDAAPRPAARKLVFDSMVVVAVSRRQVQHRADGAQRVGQRHDRPAVDPVHRPLECCGPSTNAPDARGAGRPRRSQCRVLGERWQPKAWARRGRLGHKSAPLIVGVQLQRQRPPALSTEYYRTHDHSIRQPVRRPRRSRRPRPGRHARQRPLAARRAPG